jgi:EAL domain-containing protein (putative c-di-GMP-specific phosphodiesterase class I)
VAFFHSHGIRVAMDDYGTGSASSNIVMSVPMDEIKIDMSFISGIMEKPKYQAMVHSIVDFANQSDMKTCLEGVESEELQNYLRSFGATWFQGYYYAKPLQIDSLAKLVSGVVA